MDSATKTANSEIGTLWYVETLPPKTLLCVPIIAQDARGKGVKRSARDNAGDLRSLFKAKPYLQLGGNEMVGMGWCRARFIPEVCVSAKEGE